MWSSLLLWAKLYEESFEFFLNILTQINWITKISSTLCKMAMLFIQCNLFCFTSEKKHTLCFLLVCVCVGEGGRRSHQIPIAFVAGNVDWEHPLPQIIRSLPKAFWLPIGTNCLSVGGNVCTSNLQSPRWNLI